MGSLLLGSAAKGSTGLFGTAGQFAWAPTLATTGTVVGAYGQYAQGQALAEQAAQQEAMAEYNAKLQEREAKERLARSQYAQMRQAQEATRIKSSMQARVATSGAVGGAGTPLLAQAKQAAELELKNLMIGYRGMTEAQYARSQAAIDKMQADIYGQRARSYRTAGLMGAGRTLLTGFGGYFVR